MKDFKQFIHKLWDGTKVFIVHGNYVRDNINDEFIGGGHGMQDEEIPEDEIWVEHTEEPADIKELLVHEITEYIFMKYQDESYDQAHEIANSIEDTIRRIPDYPGEAAPKTTYQDIKKKDKKDELSGNETNTGMVFFTRGSSFNKVSYIVHMKGHKNSSGEAAPYVIKSHDTGKILSSHKTRGEAEKHLQQMHAHKGKSIMEFRDIRDINELIKKAQEGDLKLFYFKPDYAIFESYPGSIDPVVAAFSEEEAWNILTNHFWDISDREHGAYSSGEYSSKEEYSNDMRVAFKIVLVEPIPTKPGILLG